MFIWITNAEKQQNTRNIKKYMNVYENSYGSAICTFNGKKKHTKKNFVIVQKCGKK